MVDSSTEKKPLLTAEKSRTAAPEQFVNPEQELTEANTAERRGNEPLPEQQKDLGDLLHLKRRARPMTIPQVRDEVTVKIEKIMEEGIAEAYQRLSPVARQEFKLRGEETARKIREIIKSGHVKVKKILQLLLEWLKMLPGVNHFFLEQEAKIKTDKIIALAGRDK